jgi:polar amino acid transport system permease protein
MRYVVLPQAFVVALPPLVNAFISLIKGTALVSIIGVPDLMHKAEELDSRTFRTMEVFTFTAGMYLMILLPLTRAAQLVEKRASRFRGRPS